MKVNMKNIFVIQYLNKQRRAEGKFSEFYTVLLLECVYEIFH